MISFEPHRERKNEEGKVFQYLLKSDSDKELFCVVSIDDEGVPNLINGNFRKKTKELNEDGWELLSSSKKQIEKYLIDNMDIDQILEMENNFYEPEKDTDNLLFLTDFDDEF